MVSCMVARRDATRTTYHQSYYNKRFLELLFSPRSPKHPPYRLYILMVVVRAKESEKTFCY